MLLHPLTNFQIQKYYQNEPKFKSVYSRNNSLKIFKELKNFCFFSKIIKSKFLFLCYYKKVSVFLLLAMPGQSMK